MPEPLLTLAAICEGVSVKSAGWGHSSALIEIGFLGLLAFSGSFHSRNATPIRLKQRLSRKHYIVLRLAPAPTRIRTSNPRHDVKTNVVKKGAETRSSV